MLFQLILAYAAPLALATPAAAPSATPTPGSPDPLPTMPACVSASVPCAFTIDNIAYQRYQPNPGTIYSGLGSMVLAFDVTNSANNVATACSFTIPRIAGQWLDNGTKWYECGSRTLVGDDGTDYVLETSAKFNWAEWTLAVNQTWVCDNTYGQESNIAANVSVLLTPDCTNSTNSAYSFLECSAPAITGNGFPIVPIS